MTGLTHGGVTTGPCPGLWSRFDPSPSGRGAVVAHLSSALARGRTVRKVARKQRFLGTIRVCQRLRQSVREMSSDVDARPLPSHRAPGFVAAARASAAPTPARVCKWRAAQSTTNPNRCRNGHVLAGGVSGALVVGEFSPSFVVHGPALRLRSGCCATTASARPMCWRPRGALSINSRRRWCCVMRRGSA